MEQVQEETRRATKRARLLLFVALVLGLAELGVWSFRHQGHTHHASRADDAEPLLTALSDAERNWRDPRYDLS